MAGSKGLWLDRRALAAINYPGVPLTEYITGTCIDHSILLILRPLFFLSSPPHPIFFIFTVSLIWRSISVSTFSSVAWIGAAQRSFTNYTTFNEVNDKYQLSDKEIHHQPSFAKDFT